MRKAQEKERGQAIVLIAISFLALIAFTGLAIDGGRLYADRRHAQNASDAGSLAGGGDIALSLENADIDYRNFNCGSSAVQNAMTAGEQVAIDSMIENGYTIGNISVDTQCYQHPQHIDITTTITKETTVSFIQIVYQEPLINVVNATTEVDPLTAFAHGNAIVALNPNGSCTNSSAGGMKFGGTGEVLITGGGTWSDGCLVTQGNCNVTIEGGSTISYYAGQFGTCPVLIPPPEPVTHTLDSDSYYLEPPSEDDCEGNRMSSIVVHNNEDEDLNEDYDDTHEARLICLTDSGNALRMTGGTLTGHGVTIYMEGGGDITINGGDVDLTGPLENDELNGAIPGVIIYAPPAEDPDNPDNNPDSNIDIEGNEYSEYWGLIYGPTADIKITGTGDLGPTLNTQIIGYNVTLLGTAYIEIEFNTDYTHTEPTSLDLVE